MKRAPSGEESVLTASAGHTVGPAELYRMGQCLVARKLMIQGATQMTDAHNKSGMKDGVKRRDLLAAKVDDFGGFD